MPDCTYIMYPLVIHPNFYVDKGIVAGVPLLYGSL